MEEDFDLENPLTFVQEHQTETIPYLFSFESDHMPCQTYVSTFKSKNFDVSLRREAISLVLLFSCKFDPFISYLAVNYLDRFLCKQDVPQGKPWILKLISLSCVSLAAKMKQTQFSLSLTDFQSEGLVFHVETINRMELLILGTLNWRMRSITPFSFIHFIFSLLKIKDSSLIQALKARATEIIFKSQSEIKTMEFKPSIMAACSLLFASHELLPMQFPCFQSTISSCLYVNKEKLLECYNVMEKIVIDGYEDMIDMGSSSQTPNNVLDLICSSSSSGTEKATNTAVRAERDIKRQKIGGFRTLKHSHIEQS